MNPSDNTLYMGNCIEVMQQWSDNSVDHCITDPPYNLSKKNGLGWAFSSHITMNETWDIYASDEYQTFCRAWLVEVCRVVRPNGNIFVFGSYHNIYTIGHILSELNLRIINSIVWFKPNAQPSITCRTLTESTEHIIWACNAPRDQASGWTFNYATAKALNGGKQMRNVWSIPYTSASERTYGKHPSQKALAVLSRLVLIATTPGDIILDCFGGSGTTGVVAQSFDRRWVMIEQNREYCEIAHQRLAHVRVPWPDELVAQAQEERCGSELDHPAVDG